MATRLYLHRASSAVGGTLPATNASVSSTAPTWTPGTTNGAALTPLLTNLTMNTIISAVAQTSLAYATFASVAAQPQPFLRWVSEPLDAQSISSQTITVSIGTSESSTNSAFSQRMVVRLWRPSSGTNVGAMRDTGSEFWGGSSTSQSAQTGSFGSTAQTAQAGDVIVLELWRTTAVQSMATSYTNTLFYDGTTEASISNIAAYLDFGTSTLTFQGAPAAAQNPWSWVPALGPILAQ